MNNKPAMILSPKKRYENDSRYHTVVRTIESHLHVGTYSPEEMREIVLLACLHYELSQTYHQDKINEPEAYPQYVLEAMDVLVKWRESRSE